jgi:hypothetical protein
MIKYIKCVGSDDIFSQSSPLIYNEKMIKKILFLLKKIQDKSYVNH